MVAQFGEKIIPFVAVGEDDVVQLFLDYDDQVKIPFVRSFCWEISEKSINLRTDRVGEVADQPQHLPVVLPKVPGRFYYLFGKPNETEEIVGGKYGSLISVISIVVLFVYLVATPSKSGAAKGSKKKR